MPQIGKISSIQTLGTLDGPGVRFVLFLHGCVLKCLYCHNPETWCGGDYTTATADDIFEKVLRYTQYFGKDGGITVSGGEPLLQSGFLFELFSKCKQNGINTVLDTSGCIFNEKVKMVLSVTDLVMLDIKMTNEPDYQKYIGCSLKSVLDFLKYLNDNQISTWIRQVIVEGINDSFENAQQLKIIRNSHNCIKKVELLPFKNICQSKYDNLKIEFPLKGKNPTTAKTIKKIYGYLYS